MKGSWDMYMAPPADFAEADDIITNLAKERELKDWGQQMHSLIQFWLLLVFIYSYFN